MTCSYSENSRVLECPWCEIVAEHRRRRCHDDGIEWRCCTCGRCHTRRPERPEVAYAFFPADIAAAFDNDLEPFIVGG